MPNNNGPVQNTTDNPTFGGVDFFRGWGNGPDTTGITVGTVVNVKTLGQTIRDSALKQRLQSETGLNSEEIPIYACDVVGVGGERYSNCQVVFPYVHSEPGLNGAGIYFIPEEGSQVIVAHIQQQPFIIGFISAVDKEEAGFRNGKEPLTKGSYAFKTSSGNRIILRKGGIVLVESTPSCLRRYIPLRDQIRDVCQNYTLTTEGGQLSWTKDPNSAKHTNLRILAFDHPKNLIDTSGNVLKPSSVIVDFGQDPKPNKQGRSIFNILVLDPDEVQQTRVNLRPNGFVDIDTVDDVDIDADGDIDITPVGTLRLGTAAGRASELIDDPEADFDGSPGGVTDFIIETCDLDLTVTVGRDSLKLVTGKNDTGTSGSTVHSVVGSHIITGSPVHLNPPASATVGNITGAVTAAGVISVTGIADAWQFTDDVDAVVPSFSESTTISTVPVVPTPALLPTSTYTVGSTLLSVYDGDPATTGVLLTITTDYTETDNGEVSIVNPSLLTNGGLIFFERPEISVITGLVPNGTLRPFPGDDGSGSASSAAGFGNQPGSPDSDPNQRNLSTLLMRSSGPGNDAGLPFVQDTITLVDG